MREQSSEFGQEEFVKKNLERKNQFYEKYSAAISNFGAQRQLRLQGWGSEKAPDPILAPKLAQSHLSAPPSFKVPLKSNILQFPSLFYFPMSNTSEVIHHSWKALVKKIAMKS